MSAATMKGLSPPLASAQMIAFAEALARAQVARDIAAMRAGRIDADRGDARADGDLRALQQR